MSYDSDAHLEENRLMWGRFVKLSAGTTAAVVVVLALMAVFLT